MNKELKLRVFDIPQNILDKINHTVIGLNGEHFHGLNRAKKLLSDKKVKYGQLKRIIHDLKNIDKINDKVRYDLCGGELMEKWSEQHLKGERDLVSNKKDGRKQADDIGGIDGERKNSHLKSHSKKASWLPPTNLIKSNSHKNSISSVKLTGLFEQVERIKKLML
jgi:nitrous oxide reductase